MLKSSHALFRVKSIYVTNKLCSILNEDWIPLDLPFCFQLFSISYFELGYFEFPTISNGSLFPYTLNQPNYFELVKNKVQEEISKPPTKSEVRQAIETLLRYSLFAVEGPGIPGQTSQLWFTTNVLENTKNNRTFKDFSMQQHLLIYLTNNYCIFI